MASLLTQEGQEFTKLLHDRVECSMFRSFVKKSACDENLMFWIEIELHKKEVKVFGGTFKVEFVRKRNEEIFNKYFKVGGNYELNLDSDAVDEIRGKLFEGSEEEANSFHLFNRAQDEVYLLMLTDSYAKFRKTNEYVQYTQKKEAEKAKQLKKMKKKKSGSFLGNSSTPSAEEAEKAKKRNSISGLSKLFSKPKHSVNPKDIALEDAYSTKLNEAPIRRTFNEGLEITESSQSTRDSMKIRARANSLEEIEILDKNHSNTPVSPRSKLKKVSVVRSRIRHSINSIRSLFSNSARENLRSPSAPADLPRADGQRIRSHTETGSRLKSKSSPALVHSKITSNDIQTKVELPRSPSDLIFDAFFLSGEPVVHTPVDSSVAVATC
eukprot:TRINITY_DN2285_c0_g1_i2.p1 TRINITY_DN2285_c0_g1~~TRINITY_DN2285_c0_g1_i2.p1  ORF type:complete len:382 (-),score=77.41 TRINITY_DN2285_c0_g1_i2:187-1332(-)